MIGSVIITMSLGFFLGGAPAAAEERSLRPFRTDGCSTAFGNIRAKWTDCCVAHDFAYWIGGTQKRKKLADDQLRSCLSNTGVTGAVAAKIFNSAIAEGMSQSHWGSGWTPRTSNAELTKDEWNLVERYHALFELRQPIVKDMSERACPAHVIAHVSRQTLLVAAGRLSCFPLVTDSGGEEWIAYSPECTGFAVVSPGENSKSTNVTAFGDCKAYVRSTERSAPSQPTCRFSNSNLMTIYLMQVALEQSLTP